MPMIAALLATLLMGIPQTATVSGKVLDRTGQPLANAQIVYTHTDTGRVYKFKTNKKGEFSGVGVAYGDYQIEITGPDGAHLLKTKRRIADPNTPDFKTDTNTLTVDLSIMPGSDTTTGVAANVLPGDRFPGDKLSQQQKDLIRAENLNTLKINDLVVQLHKALGAKDWPTATNVLQQLIAADPNRWEFYQNLGTVQTNQSRYQEAVLSYEKGIQVAQNTIAKGDDPVTAKKEISLMMVYAGDAYSRIGNSDKAIEVYMKAAEISPEPATAYFNICRIQRNNGNTEAAKAACEKAIAIDPNKWEAYQTLGGIEQNTGQNQAATETYDKGIEMAQKTIASGVDLSRAKTALGQMLSAEGNIYIHMKNFDQAIELFNKAVEVDSYPALDYFNLCATYYDVKNHEAALGACEKAIASDPKMADPYFIKASVLYGQGKLEHGKFIPPPDAAEALTKYLELDPNGPHANDAREMLQKIGSEIETTYKTRKK